MEQPLTPSLYPDFTQELASPAGRPSPGRGDAAGRRLPFPAFCRFVIGWAPRYGVLSKNSSVVILLRFSNGSGYLPSHGQMAWDPHWDTAIHGSHAPGVGTGEPRASAATRRVEGAPTAATAQGYGPDLLGGVVEALEELAEFAADGAARDRGRLAPAGVQALLGVEESTPTRSACDQDGAPRSDSADEPRQSSLGCAEDSRGAAEAGPDGIAGDGFEVHAPAAAAAVAGVAHVFEESRQGSDRVGFLHGAHGDLSGPVRARGAAPRPAAAGAS